jgi:arsenate reductase (glutaredoxin)
MIQIYHNPRCTKSRETLQLLETQGVTLEVVEYLKDIPNSDEISELLTKLGLRAEQLVRKSEAVYKEKFRGKELSENQWIQAMIDNPKLIQRPIVVNGNQARIGRPPESVLEII